MGDVAETVAAARRAIGADDPGSDWQLAPETHAASLPPQAAALSRVLASPGVAEHMAVFSENDRLARQAQRRYKTAGHIGLYSSLAATLTGALFIVMPPDGNSGSLTRTLAIAPQYLMLMAGILSSLYIVRTNVLKSWMESRARAELARIALFDAVMAAGPGAPPGAGELPLLPLQLEYFRRYQLDVQRRYYRNRGAEHARAAGHSLAWKRTAYLLTGISGAVTVFAMANLAALLGIPFPRPAERIIEWLGAHEPLVQQAALAAGTAASALFGVTMARSLMNFDERNAVTYANVAAALEHLTDERLGPAREAAAKGDRETVRAFAAAVQETVSLEHKEWYFLRKAVPAVPSQVLIR